MESAATGNHSPVVSEPPIAFVFARDDVGLEIRVSFGIFAGREVTPAELHELGRSVVLEVSPAAVVAENRHQVGGGETEAALHQVRIEVPEWALPTGSDALDHLRERLVDLTSFWARTCIGRRHAEVVESFPETLY